MGAPRSQATHALRAAAIFGIASAFAILDLAPCARAGALYYELAGGGALWRDSGALYNGGNPSGTGYGANADVFITLGGSGGPIEFQGGLLSRYTIGSDGSNSYTLVTLYPELRMQVNFLFIGAGITPLVLRSGGPNGSSSFDGPPSRLAYDAEGGLLWSVVPIFSLGVAASAEWASSSAGLGPAPLISGTVLLRFYFGFFGRHGGGGSSDASSESRGWRYPFGEWIGK